MTSLPIVQRELQVASRQRLTFWSRLVAALLGFLAVFFILGVEPDPTGAGTLGATLFRVLTTAAFWTCLYGGALLTADCLSVEKREGTLGLLFLTDLKGYDIVLGKLVAKSLTAVYGLLAILPMLAVPILLGGVTGGDFWRVVLALLNTAFLSLAVGLLTSVFCRNGRDAFAVAVFLIFLLTIFPLVARQLVPPFWRWLPELFSPVLSFNTAFSGLTGLSSTFYQSAPALHLLAWLLLLVAGWRVPASWQEGRKVQPLRDRWRNLWRGAPQSMIQRRTLLAINPILWLESRDRRMRLALIGLFALLTIGGLFVHSRRNFGWADMESALSSVMILHVVLMLLIALDASGRMVELKRDDHLVLILSTPLSPAEVMRGEFLAARGRFGWPLATVIAFDFIWLGQVLRFQYSLDVFDPLLLMACLITLLMVNSHAIFWTGLAGGMKSKRHYRAGLLAFAIIVGAPLILLLLILRTNLWGNVASLLIFSGLSLVISWLFSRGARQRFQSDLREILTGHPRPPEKDFNEDYALLK